MHTGNIYATLEEKRDQQLNDLAAYAAAHQPGKPTVWDALTGEKVQDIARAEFNNSIQEAAHAINTQYYMERGNALKNDPNYFANSSTILGGNVGSLPRNSFDSSSVKPFSIFSSSTNNSSLGSSNNNTFGYQPPSFGYQPPSFGYKP